MDSKYAYIHFIEGIGSTDQTKDGKLVQLNYPIQEGETNLVSIQEYKMFEKDFPDRIKGDIIKQDNLMNVLNLIWAQLKKEIESLSEIDDYTKSKFNNIKNGFEIDGLLKPDHQTDSSINDLANKIFILQEQVRAIQRKNMSKTSFHR